MRPKRRRLPWVALAALSVAIFVAITSEYLPTGLLPQMARGLGVPESLVGLLVTAFAITVVLTAAPLVTVSRRLDRKWLVLALLVTLAISNLLVAVAPTYAVVLGARILGGLANGLFWAVVGAYAAHLVPREDVGRAVAVTGLAATLAFVLGVPVGTALGGLVGWRLAFAAVALAIALAAVVVWRVLPRVERHVFSESSDSPRISWRADPVIVGIAAVCATTIVIVVGQNTVYTYIVPFVTEVAGFGSTSVSILLLVYGGAGAGGVVLAGILGSHRSRVSVWTGAVLVVLLVSIVGLFPGNHWLFVPAVALWAVVIGGLPTVLQTTVMRLAPPRLRDVSSAYYATSFNIGVAGGALLGGGVIDAWGPAALPFVDVAVTASVVLAVPVTVVIGRLNQRRLARASPPPTDSASV